MRIAILTHPLWTNYGGILQAYALQTFLQRHGHEVTIINREYNDYPSLPLFVLRIGSVIKSFFRSYILGQKKYVVKNPLSAFYHNQWTGYDVLPFVKENINHSRELRNSKELSHYLKINHFDCYVVGSDQVWRPCYVANITDYFLKDVPSDSKSIKISYAASFGTDSWEFSPSETKECSSLAKLFDAISVREKSGVRLCKDYLGVSAQHLIDPTMLLTVQDYIALINRTKTEKSKGNAFCYVLDACDEINEVIRDIRSSGYKPFSTSIFVQATKENPRPYQMSVEQWLRSFYDSELIITDSFHACVFSILFKKPFIVWANKSKGCARFESLLEMFGMQHRLISTIADFYKRKHTLFNIMDFEYVDLILHKYQEKSNMFFKSVDII